MLFSQDISHNPSGSFKLNVETFKLLLNFRPSLKSVANVNITKRI